jgi:adenylate cyclase
MAAPRVDRRLAAIMAVDVVGYSRLIGADEAGTLVRVKAHRLELAEPLIAEHHGRVVKLTGDGALVEFASAVDAVECAVAIQAGMAEREAAEPEARRIQYRIGINIGDIVLEDGDIFGDGVNVAARLEGLAEPGGICIARNVYNQVKATLGLDFKAMGEHRVRNIAEPITVYRVRPGPGARPQTKPVAITWALRGHRPAAIAGTVLLLIVVGTAAGWYAFWRPSALPPAAVADSTGNGAAKTKSALPLPDKPSIAVLPFLNMSGDPQQEYLAEGITDDLITDLSKISGLFVIARNSTFIYQNRPVTPKQVSQELGVQYVLEGSVQRAGARVRINAQLVDAIGGGHEWAERFDGSLTDVFALQDKVTGSVAAALAVRLTETDQIALNLHETSVPAAYDAFLRGWVHLRRDTPDDYATAIPYLKEATKLDPDYGRAYAALAMAYILSYDAQWTDYLGVSEIGARQRAKRYLEDARRHPTVLSHQVAAVISLIDLQPNEALAELKEAIAIDSGDAFSYAYMGAAMTASGRPADAVPHIRTAMRLDPHYPPIFDYLFGSAQFGMENFEEASGSFATATRRNPKYEYAFAGLAAAYGHLGRKQDAASAIARYNDLIVGRGGVPLTIGTAPRCGFIRSADVERFHKGLRLAGVPEFLPSGEFATQNRVTAEAIRALIFGHRLRGRSLWTGEERLASITGDGVVELAGDWGLLGGGPLTGGSARFDGDQLCYKFDLANYCGDVLRNPGGTRVKENEFIWYNGEAFTFSRSE